MVIDPSVHAIIVHGFHHGVLGYIVRLVPINRQDLTTVVVEGWSLLLMGLVPSLSMSYRWSTFGSSWRSSASWKTLEGYRLYVHVRSHKATWY